jgi:DNA-binding NarL/FixJ family response regulator
LKNQDIATNMNISVNSVKLYKKNAYQKLRESIGKGLALLVFI